MIEKQLQELGLTGGETKAYLALLGLGPSTVGPIVKKSRIAYSNIYEVLERLIEKGFVSFFIKEKTKHFQAADPTRVMDFLEEKEEKLTKQKEEAAKIIKQLQSLNVPGKQESEIFIGTKGLRTAYEKLLSGYKKGTTAYFIYPYDKEWVDMVDQFFLQQNLWVGKVGIQWKGVSNVEYKNSRFLREVKHKPQMKFVNFPLPAKIDLYQDKALILSWSKKPVGILIHSNDFVKTFSLFFEHLWKVAKS